VPEVTLCIANVPALADHAGAKLDRKPGWPELNPKRDSAIAAASDYVDVVNLAGMIRCETILSIGLIDRICSPTSVWLVYQQLQCPKHVTLYPRLGHNAPPRESDGRKRIAKEVGP